MASGIVIHSTADGEKRTEFFLAERVRIGNAENAELNLAALDGKARDFGQNPPTGIWLELLREGGYYRIADFRKDFKFNLNGAPLQPFAKISDGDVLTSDSPTLHLQFFNLSSSAQMSVEGTNRRAAKFIETAALEANATAKRDDAKIFLREFTRELIREISPATKFILFGLTAATLAGAFYLGFSLYDEMRRNREQNARQQEIIGRLEQQLSTTNNQLNKLGESNEQLIRTVSLANNLRNEYGGGVCLIVGTYDLVSKRNGKVLRYPDPRTLAPDPYEPDMNPTPMEGEESPVSAREPSLTTEGSGAPLEFDFVGTGFYVGKGYVLTNRHVVQSWASDDSVKSLMRMGNGRARLKSVVVYFPNIPQSFALKIRDVSNKEDIAVGVLDANFIPPDVRALPLAADDDSGAIGKTVVTIGYPNGPDRILAMVDDTQARAIQSRFGSNLMQLINYLAQSKMINPLTTQGSITDLDARRIVHDAKTAEGGSGAPLFGQSGKVIGVNFGVFTGSTAANMAVPIRFALELLQKNGWSSPDTPPAQNTDSQAKDGSANAPVVVEAN